MFPYTYKYKQLKIGLCQQTFEFIWNTRKRARKVIGMVASILENGLLELSVFYVAMGTGNLCFHFAVCLATLERWCLTIIC